MRKRILCGIMAVFTLWSVNAPTAKAANINNTVVEYEAEDDMHVDKYTINFDASEQVSVLDNQSTILVEKNRKAIEHNRVATNAAKQYVQDLNLQDAGLGFIEVSCLEELNRLAKCDDFILTSYTVRVPTGALSSKAKSVPFENLSYYGTYGGIDFYYYYYSEVSGTVNYKKTTSMAKQWFQNAIDLVLCYADAEITVPLTLVKQKMGNPYGYVPNTKAYCEYGFNINIRTRGIYTKYTTLLPTPHTTYEEVCSGQIGHLYPGVVYYPVESPKYEYSYSINLGYKGPVYTPYFNNKNQQLRDAYSGLNGAYIHRKVMNYASSYYWSTC